jgi:hypothetical protein
MRLAGRGSRADARLPRARASIPAEGIDEAGKTI